MQPVVNGLKEKYQDRIKFAVIDYYDANNRAFNQQLRVNGHPTFVLVDGKGEVVKRWIGVTEGEVLESSLKEVLAR